MSSTALAGASGYFRKELVPLRTAVVFLIPSRLAVGGLIVTEDLLVAFAKLMIAAATTMNRSRQAEGALGNELRARLPRERNQCKASGGGAPANRSGCPAVGPERTRSAKPLQA